ncbi:hypothetical protein, partial [Kingella kingae]|uniref:hypothetical protein n=1 Tax=Kingella kingae TaxID=504 RepID=UPI000570C883
LGKKEDNQPKVKLTQMQPEKSTDTRKSAPVRTANGAEFWRGGALFIWLRGKVSRAVRRRNRLGAYYR